VLSGDRSLLGSAERVIRKALQPSSDQRDAEKQNDSRDNVIPLAAIDHGALWIFWLGEKEARSKPNESANAIVWPCSSLNLTTA
jgi:hypothetical protein